MIQVLYNASASLSDAAILAMSAAAFGALGGLLAHVSNRLWFWRWPVHSAHEDKLADTAHSSMLAFAAFVLALSVTNVFSNAAKTEDSVRQEALEIYRLDRELGGLGASTLDARRALGAYAEHMKADEWPRLAMRPATLLPLAQGDLLALWKGVRAAQDELGATRPAVREDLGKYLSQIEQLRESRLAAATNSIPDVFWPIIVLFIVAISFMSGRGSPRHFGTQINVIQMSAIGLIVGLIVIIDNPFRGQTSVSADIISQALQR
jgi:MFS family permease